MQTRRAFGFGLACSLLAGARPSRAQRLPDAPVAIPAERAADSYAIWSLLVPLMQKPKKDYLVADITTAPGGNTYSQAPIAGSKGHLTIVQRHEEMERGIAIEVPDDGLASFNEAAVDYQAHSFGRVQLQQKLMLPRPYHLMNLAERGEYARLTCPMVQATSQPWRLDPKLAKHYKGRGPMTSMSQVYFDKPQTLALVWASDGESCKWYVFGKKTGMWERLPWACRGMTEVA